MDEMIKRLNEKVADAGERRAAAVAARQALLDAAETEKRDALTEDEDTEFRAKTAEITAIDAEIAELEARAAELEAEKERTAKAEAAAVRAGAYKPAGGAQVVHEELTYAKRNGRSYVKDMVQGLILHDADSVERLARHAREVSAAPEFAEFRTNSGLTRVDGAGGYFVPPAWLMDQWIQLARPGRPTADLIGSSALPPGTDTINVPKLTGGTATGVQNGDLTTVQMTDATDNFITFPVRTIAGEQLLAIQLIDQSPLNFDEIILKDLIADYAVKTDLQVLNGGGTNGEVTGLLQTSGRTSVAVSTVTGMGVYSAVANTVQQVHTSRFQSPRVIVMHPRRWAWLQVQVDANGRPLVLPRAYNPQNNVGEPTQLAPQGPVGDFMGLPVVLDASIPTNLGSGTNEDRILVLRPEDLMFYESSIRSRVLPERSSQSLGVVIQIYGYLAFSAARYPSVTGVVTGLTPPSF